MGNLGHKLEKHIERSGNGKSMDSPILVKIPRLVCHGFKTEGDKEAVVINVPTLPYNHKEPDEIRIDAFRNDIPYDWKK